MTFCSLDSIGNCLSARPAASAQNGNIQTSLGGFARLSQKLTDFTVERESSRIAAGSRVGGRCVGGRIGQAAEAQRQLSHLGGDSDDFALLWCHLERCGMRHERLPVFAVELLIDAYY